MTKIQNRYEDHIKYILIQKFFFIVLYISKMTEPVKSFANIK